MSAKTNPEAGPEDGSEEPDVDTEDVRDFFLAEDEPLGVSDISEEFDISEETTQNHLD